MKVFIAGATGVLGRRVVKRLVEAGHEVLGLCRSTRNRDLLESLGAVPRDASLFDLEQVKTASAGCDAILHLATCVPTDPRNRPSDWKPNDLIRRKGTKHLVAAALDHGCKLYVQQSVTFVYGQRDGAWVDESTPVEPFPGILKSAFDMERIVEEARENDGLPAVTLRSGFFYSHDSAQTEALLSLTEKGQAPVVGDGSAYWSLVHVDDAAAAFAAAVERSPAGIGKTFNVCDDEPVRYGELQHGVAELLGAKKPGRIPRFLAKMALGAHAIEFMEASARVRNGAVKEALGWKPAYPTWREGYAQVIGARRAEAASG